MGKFTVGDEVVPNEGADAEYSTTNSRHMVKGVVEKVREGRASDIYIEITEGDRTGHGHWVKSEYFDLLAPLSADEAFERFLRGSFTEAQYSEAMRKVRG